MASSKPHGPVEPPGLTEDEALAFWQKVVDDNAAKHQAKVDREAAVKAAKLKEQEALMTRDAEYRRGRADFISFVEQNIGRRP